MQTLTAPAVRSPLFAAAVQANLMLIGMEPRDARFSVQLNDSGVPFLRLSWPDSFAHFNLSTVGDKAALSAEYTDPDYETHALNIGDCETPLSSLRPHEYACELFTAVCLALRQNPITSERF